VFLPIGDQPNPRGFTPWVNYALIGVNVAVWLLISLPLTLRAPDPNDPAVQELLRQLILGNPQVDPHLIASAVLRRYTAYDIFLVSWGYRPGDPSPIALMTSMFLHGGWLHLLGNMLFLWIYGDNVEHRLGRIGYLGAYLATGVAAALGYGAFVPASAGGVPMVGASGAISGVLGFYFLWFPRNKVRLFVLLFVFVDIWLVNARIVLGFYLIVENLLPFLLRSDEGGGGVAYGAHIGGFVAGLAIALAVDQWVKLRCRRQARGCGQEVRPSDLRGGDSDADPDAVSDALRAGNPAEAVQLYLSSPPARRRQVPVPVVHQLAVWLDQEGQPDAALALYSQALGDHPRGPDLDRIFLGIGLVLLHSKGRPTAAYQYLMDALEADPSPGVERAAREGLAQIERMQKLRWRGR
jgi:membrane associated rhomboid family serine protease